MAIVLSMHMVLRSQIWLSFDAILVINCVVLYKDSLFDKLLKERRRTILVTSRAKLAGAHLPARTSQPKLLSSHTKRLVAWDSRCAPWNDAWTGDSQEGRAGAIEIRCYQHPCN